MRRPFTENGKQDEGGQLRVSCHEDFTPDWPLSRNPQEAGDRLQVNIWDMKMLQLAYRPHGFDSARKAPCMTAWPCLALGFLAFGTGN